MTFFPVVFFFVGGAERKDVSRYKFALSNIHLNVSRYYTISLQNFNPLSSYPMFVFPLPCVSYPMFSPWKRI